MTETALVRIAVLLLPASLLFLLHVAGEHSARQRSAALFAGLWCGLCALCLSAIGVHTGNGAFHASGAALYGVPVDLALACGLSAAAVFLLPAGCRRRLPLAVMAVFLYVVFCLGFFSSLKTPVLAGYAFFSVVPAYLLGLWTAEDRCIYARSFLQALVWSTLLLWLLPASALTRQGRHWDILFSHPFWMYLPLALPACLMAHALYVFARYGDGTGFPYDPPKRLVTQGIYGYVSNPMQIAICLAMGWWGVLLQNGVVMACAPLALMLFVVFKDVCNGSSNLCGQDPLWAAYQAAVPRWRPRGTAYAPASNVAAQNNPDKKRP